MKRTTYLKFQLPSYLFIQNTVSKFQCWFHKTNSVICYFKSVFLLMGSGLMISKSIKKSFTEGLVIKYPFLSLSKKMKRIKILPFQLYSSRKIFIRSNHHYIFLFPLNNVFFAGSKHNTKRNKIGFIFTFPTHHP